MLPLTSPDVGERGAGEGHRVSVGLARAVGRDGQRRGVDRLSQTARAAHKIPSCSVDGFDRIASCWQRRGGERRGGAGSTAAEGRSGPEVGGPVIELDAASGHAAAGVADGGREGHRLAVGRRIERGGEGGGGGRVRPDVEGI